MAAKHNIPEILAPDDRFRQLETVANSFNIDKNQPIRRYYRSGTEMVRMADTYLDEENYEKAYILYLKFLTLFIEKVREHPDFKTVSPTEKSHVMKKVKSVMPRSEELKKLLKAQYQNEYHDYQKMLEIQKKNEEAKAEKERQIQMKLEGEKIREAIYNYHDEKEKTLQKQRDFEVALWHQLKINQEEPSAPPLVPPSDFDESNIKNNVNIDRSTKPKIESTSSSAVAIPVIPDRNTKPASLGLYSSSGGLRSVQVPSLLMAKFISIAEPNTKANIETCGVLAGKLSQNKFQITHLIIPKQSGTADSCTTTGEEAIFDYQEKYSLITLGWIHTHPTQTAFLSSVDLHTQLSYQLMLPEAIAIVISPKYNETGIFSLTPDHGLNFIANCREQGFHPHPKDPPLFAELDHVTVDENSDVILVDLRKL